MQVHAASSAAAVVPPSTSAGAVESTGPLKTLTSAVPIPPPPFLPSLPIPPPMGEAGLVQFTKLPDPCYTVSVPSLLAVVSTTIEAPPTDLPIPVSTPATAEGGGTPPPDDHTPEKGDVWELPKKFYVTLICYLVRLLFIDIGFWQQSKQIHHSI